jgi:hypothetical protein
MGKKRNEKDYKLKFALFIMNYKRLHKLESDYNKSKNGEKASVEKELDKDTVSVRAIISCPTCGTEKAYKNRFSLKAIEQMVVSLKIFDWLTCSECGELLKLDLEFKL